MPRLDLIAHKLAHVSEMADQLARNVAVVYRIGGHDSASTEDEAKFQRRRADNLAWAFEATDEEIEARIVEIGSTLTADELACKYGTVRGLSVETIEAIAKIEDLEIALGVHPAVR